MNDSSDILEREIINLIKNIAILSTEHIACQKHVTEQLNYVREKLTTKYDKSEAKKIIDEIEELRKKLEYHEEVMGFDNSKAVKRSMNIVTTVVTWGFISIGVLTSIIGISVGLLRMTGVL